jgi:hypothetical protein
LILLLVPLLLLLLLLLLCRRVVLTLFSVQQVSNPDGCAGAAGTSLHRHATVCASVQQRKSQLLNKIRNGTIQIGGRDVLNGFTD